MAHPVRGDDGQPPAVGDVVVGAEGVLDAVAGPARRTVAERENAVAAIGAGQHHLGTGCVIFRVLQALAAVHHQTAQHRLAEAVVQQRSVLREVLFHHVVHRIGNACGGLFPADSEGVGRVEERYGRVEQPVTIADLVVGFGARDDPKGVVFAAGGRKGDDINDG